MKKIPPSKNSTRLSDKLRSDSDSVHSFVTTQIKKTNKYEDFIEKEELYNLYSRFWLKEDCIPYKRKNFYRSLESFGFVEMKNGEKAVYIGIINNS